MIVNKFINLLCLSILSLGTGSHAMDVPQHNAGKLKRKLRDAALSGNIKQVEALLNQGALADPKDNKPPLILAAQNGHTDVCKLLIENKAKIYAINKNGKTPLMVATEWGHKQTCALLISEVNVPDYWSRTPLIRAVSSGRYQICKLLIENKAIIDTKDMSDQNALLIAARYGYIEIGELLLAHHAQIDVKDSNGRTPMMWAASREHEYFCKLLINTMLMQIKRNQPRIVALLGIKKFRNVDFFRLIGREIIQLIVRPPYEFAKQQLRNQINQIENEKQRDNLLNYAKKQFNAQKMKTPYE